MPRTKKDNEYQYKYNKSHLKRVPLDMQLEEYEKLKQFCFDQKLGINTFIKQAIKEKLERDAAGGK